MLLIGERSDGSLAVYVADIIGAPAALIKQARGFARRNPNWLRIVKKNYGFWWISKLLTAIYAR